MFGFLNVNRALSLSSTQSISLPMTLSNALESINTLTPSCSTCSSNFPGLSTYSKWYAEPEHPLFLTPTLMSLGSGESSSSRRCSTADGVREIAAFRGLKVRVGLVGFAAAFCSDALVSCNTGLGFCASCSGILCDGCVSDCEPFPCCCSHDEPLLQLNEPPAIDVSGTAAFLGGGGPGSSVEGR